MDISSAFKVRTKIWSVSPSVDMLPFGVTTPATVPQMSEIPEGLMNNPVHSGQQRKSGLLANLSFVHSTPVFSASPSYKSLLEGSDHGVTVEIFQPSEFGTFLWVK